MNHETRLTVDPTKEGMRMLVKNRSWSPRILTVSGGKKGKPKTIALRGRHSVELSQEELESPQCQQLIATGDLFILPEKAAKKTARTR